MQSLGLQSFTNCDKACYHFPFSCSSLLKILKYYIGVRGGGGGLGAAA